MNPCSFSLCTYGSGLQCVHYSGNYVAIKTKHEVWYGMVWYGEGENRKKREEGEKQKNTTKTKTKKKVK